MSDLTPPNIPSISHAADDLRLGTLIGQTDPANARVFLIGFPVDEGVRRNGGRVGAAQAPDAIRRCLFKLTPDAEHYDTSVSLLRSTADLGDLQTSGDLEAAQAKLGEVLAPHLERGAIAMVLGGGHETSFGHLLGYASRGKQVAILNWDAHPDVRPLKDGKAHSGSPFRQALLHENKACTGYTVAGLNPPSVARAHLDFIRAHGGSYLFNHQLDRNRVDALYAGIDRDTLVTFDMDAVDQAAAPGVSAPAAGGLSVDLWLDAAEAAGRCAHVRSFDLVEVNPAFDSDDRTARLAALTVWRFLRGLAARTLSPR